VAQAVAQAVEQAGQAQEAMVAEGPKATGRAQGAPRTAGAPWMEEAQAMRRGEMRERVRAPESAAPTQSSGSEAASDRGRRSARARSP
jgi:hypothetical protein